ncbi:MAG: hypothetical protein ACTSSG_07365 [Candidatus Heimdallarchaeaceae archaeon]
MIVRYILKSEENVPWDDLKENLRLWKFVDERTGKENFIRLVEDQDQYLVAVLRYYVKLKETEIKLDENDEEVREENEVTSQKWARIYFLRPHSPMYLLIRFQPETSDNKHIRNKVRMLVSRCIGGNDDYFQYAQFNIEAIHDDYSEDTWAGAIKNRANNVRSGVLYGSNIAADSDFGQGYVRSPKNFIGVNTSYFGEDEAIRYNKHSFQFFKDHDDDEIIAWFMNEGRKYIRT